MYKTKLLYLLNEKEVRIAISWEKFQSELLDK